MFAWDKESFKTLPLTPKAVILAVNLKKKNCKGIYFFEDN